jgi:hypothetical protein
VINNTLAQNNVTAGSGGGIYCASSSPVVTNNIIAFNSSGVFKSSGSPSLRNNCVHNTPGVDYSGLGTGIGDVSADPLLADRLAGDYRLAAGSPCIDAGYNAGVPDGVLTDFPGHLRLFDDPATLDCRWSPENCGAAPIVDMGAYEFIPEIPGDVDGDGDVDGFDGAALRACASGPAVGVSAECAVGDLDGDGDGDQDDFGIFQRCYSGSLRAADAGCAD